MTSIHDGVIVYRDLKYKRTRGIRMADPRICWNSLILGSVIRKQCILRLKILGSKILRSKILRLKMLRSKILGWSIFGWSIFRLKILSSREIGISSVFSWSTAAWMYRKPQRREWGRLIFCDAVSSVVTTIRRKSQGSLSWDKKGADESRWRTVAIRPVSLFFYY